MRRRVQAEVAEKARAADAKARADLGAAYPLLAKLDIGKAYKVSPPTLTAEIGPGGWRVELRRWWWDGDGWDLATLPVSGVLHATWGEAQAELQELFERRPE